ncbi:MAG: hypothetical protein D6822_04110, partial [Cyanobacteria bacterium J149]
TTSEAQFDIKVNPLNDKATLATATTTFDLGSPDDPLAITGISVADVDLVNVAVGETDRIRVTIDPKLTQAYGSQNSGDTFDSGTLNLTNTTGITFIQGNNNTLGNKLVIEGTLADINNALASLTYQTNTDLNQTIALNITVDDRLYDGSGDANGGTLNQGTNGGTLPLSDENNTVTRVININVSTENDPPTLTVPLAQTVNEDTQLSLNGISVSDLDDFDGDSNKITLSVANGTINISDTSGLTNISGNGTGTIVLTGTFDAINNVLRNDNVRYQGNANFNGSDPLTVTVEDLESVGVNDPNSSYTVTDTVPITVTPVNDAPVVTVPNTQILNNSSITFSSGNGNLISINDINDFNVTNTPDAVNNFRVTLTVTKSGNPDGTLTINGASGLVDSNTDAHIVVLEGTKESINQALDGLVYAPSDSNSDQAATLTVLVEDLGNGGTLIGGNGGNLTDQKQVIINVSDINDRPFFNQLDGTSANPYIENGSAIILDNDAILKDNELELFNNWRGSVLTIQRGTVDGSNNGTFTPNAEDIFGGSILSGGNVIVSGTTIGTFTNTGGVLTINFNNNATNSLVNNALQQVTYRNSSEDPLPSVNLVYTINDGNSINGDPIPSGSQGSGGALSFSQAITVNITPQPDAPVITPTTGNAIFTEAVGQIGNNTAIDVDDAITLTDVDDTQMTNATISISSGFITGDVLNINGATVGQVIAGTNITFDSYNSGTGVLTLSGTDTKANYEAVLKSLTFVHTGDNPTSTTRTVTYNVTDANSDGAGAATGTATRNITVIPVNDEPTLTSNGLDPKFVEGNNFKTLFNNSVTSTIEAGQFINQLVFTVDNIRNGTSERIRLNGVNRSLSTNVTNLNINNGFT